jgi:hypothetical protein
LKGAGIEEGFLDGVQLVAADAFDGRHPASRHVFHRRHARVHRLVVEQHRAGAAMRFAAAELRPRQLQVVAQDPKQRTLVVHRHRGALAVQRE